MVKVLLGKQNEKDKQNYLLRQAEIDAKNDKKKKKEMALMHQLGEIQSPQYGNTQNFDFDVSPGLNKEQAKENQASFADQEKALVAELEKQQSATAQHQGNAVVPIESANEEEGSEKEEEDPDATLLEKYIDSYWMIHFPEPVGPTIDVKSVTNNED